jgi:hypothetical protein
VTDGRTGGDCPGACNNRYRRAMAIWRATRAAYDAKLDLLPESAPVPEPPRKPTIEPVPGAPVWCGPCQARISGLVADLDDLASRLAVLPPGILPASDTRVEQVRVSRSPDPASPSPAADTLDELAGWLRSWERLARPTRVPRRGVLSSEITAITGWLGAHLAAILADETWADDLGQTYAEAFGTQTAEWHRYLVRATHSGTQPKHVKQPCPAKGCGRFTLWEYPGETYLRCVNPACNARPTREEIAA